MEIVRHLVAPVDATTLFRHVDDLDEYREWMPVIHSVKRLDVSVEGFPAWEVELRAQIGPFARSKRLRMERTAHVVDRLAFFERRELDGRTHSAWVLRAEIAAVGNAADLTMTLTYDGSLWTGAVLQRVLDDQIRRGSDALLALVTP